MLLSSDLLPLFPVLYDDSFKPTHLVEYCYTCYIYGDVPQGTSSMLSTNDISIIVGSKTTGSPLDIDYFKTFAGEGLTPASNLDNKISVG